VGGSDSLSSFVGSPGGSGNAKARAGSERRMSPKVYIGGKLYEKADAKISVFDHGLLYGDGVFEGIRSYSGHVFRLEAHVARLYDSARAINLVIPMTQAAMAQAVIDTLKANNLIDAYIRLVVTRGAGSLGLDPRKTSDPQVIIITDSISLYPPELYESGLKIVTAGTMRNHPSALNPRIKSLNYLNSILAKIEGTNAGCLETLMLNHKGEVAECTGDNIFVVRKGEVHTPSIDAGILEGITREAVIEIAREAGYKVFERTMDRHDIYTADECFLTGTAAEVIPVVELDGRPIGDGKPGKITADLLKRFTTIVRGGK
jgi:branched-chain amino acid aminotransferase